MRDVVGVALPRTARRALLLSRAGTTKQNSALRFPEALGLPNSVDYSPRLILILSVILILASSPVSKALLVVVLIQEEGLDLRL